MNVVFRADAKHTGDERDKGIEISVGGEFVEMARFGIDVLKTLK
jgi:hypothetical protein